MKLARKWQFKYHRCNGPCATEIVCARGVDHLGAPGEGLLPSRMYKQEFNCESIFKQGAVASPLPPAHIYRDLHARSACNPLIRTMRSIVNELYIFNTVSQRIHPLVQLLILHKTLHLLSFYSCITNLKYFSFMKFLQLESPSNNLATSNE